MQQRIIAALALSGASAFVAPQPKISAVARASDAAETAEPAKTGFTYGDLKVWSGVRTSRDAVGSFMTPGCRSGNQVARLDSRRGP
jgi:hypothetical protein